MEVFNKMSVIAYPTKEQALDMNKNDLIEILTDNGITKYDRRYSEETLVDALEENGLLSNDEITDYEDEEMTYYVRYIGTYRANIHHNSNSTPTGTEYQFPRGQFVSVHKKDYEEKYEKKVIAAIESGQLPQWEVKETSSIRGRIDKYSQKIKAIARGRTPKHLHELKYMNDRSEKRLREHSIRTIKQLAKYPPEWVAKVLNIEFVKAIDMLEDAKEAIRKQALEGDDK